MFTLLIDGDNIDIIEEWAKSVKANINKLSDVYHSESKSYKDLVDFCKENGYNAMIKFEDKDTSGHLFALLDNVNFVDFIPTENITMQVHSDQPYNDFNVTHSYYTIKSNSYVNSILSKLEDIYHIEKQSQMQNLSDMISMDDNRKPSEKLNNILKSKSKKKKKKSKR